jgi:hypothetical protein
MSSSARASVRASFSPNAARGAKAGSLSSWLKRTFQGQTDWEIRHPFRVSHLQSARLSRRRYEADDGRLARQCAGAVGSLANCQVLVSLTLARGEVPVCVALRLFVPAEWTDEPARCRAVGVPEDRLAYRTEGEITLAELDRVLAAGVRFGRVLADASPAARRPAAAIAPGDPSRPARAHARRPPPLPQVQRAAGVAAARVDVAK